MEFPEFGSIGNGHLDIVNYMVVVPQLPHMFKHGLACIIAQQMLIFRFRLAADECFITLKLILDLGYLQINLEQDGMRQLKKYS